MATGDNTSLQRAQLEAAIGEFNKINEEMDDKIVRMGNAVQDFASAWTGEAQVAFNQQFTPLKQNLATINGNLLLLVQDLNMSAEMLEEQERKNAAAWEAAEDTSDPFTVQTM